MVDGGEVQVVVGEGVARQNNRGIRAVGGGSGTRNGAALGSSEAGRRRVKRQPLMTLLSTRTGAHGRVPNTTLVKTLEDELNLHSTEGNGRGLSWSFEVGP